MKKMCVFMMCGGRGSAHLIGKTLDSLKPIMNFLVFQDNGIQDNSGKIVKEWCVINDTKLHYYEVDWRNPGWNRGHSYHTAVSLYNEHKSDWLFRMDADEYIEFVSDDFEISGSGDTKTAYYSNGSSRFTRETFFNTHSDLVWDDQESHEIAMKEDGDTYSGLKITQDMLLIMSPPKIDVAQETPLQLHHRYYRESMELEKKAFLRDNLEEWSSKDLYHLYYAGKNVYDCCYWGEMDIWKHEHLRNHVISRGMWYFETWLRYHNIWLTDMDNVRTVIEYLRLNSFYYDYGYYAYWCLANMNRWKGKSFTESLLYYEAGNKLNPERNEIFDDMLDHYISIEDWSSAYNVCLQMNDKKNPSQYYGAFVADNSYQDTSTQLQNKIDLVLKKV
jgi:hypothetical protein